MKLNPFRNQMAVVRPFSNLNFVTAKESRSRVYSTHLSFPPQGKHVRFAKGAGRGPEFTGFKTFILTTGRWTSQAMVQRYIYTRHIYIYIYVHTYIHTYIYIMYIYILILHNTYHIKSTNKKQTSCMKIESWKISRPEDFPSAPSGTPEAASWMSLGLNSHNFHIYIIVDKLIKPIVRVYIPLIWIPCGMTILNIRSLDSGTYL